MDTWKGSMESSFDYARRAAGGHLQMKNFYEPDDWRSALAKRLQQECFESMKPWIDLLCDIENRHFPKLLYTPLTGEYQRIDNYTPEDAELRAKIQQVIKEIGDAYMAEFERLK